MWKAGEIIRSKDSGHPYFVVHVYKNVCTLIFDCTSSGTFRNIGILLPSDYEKFAKDKDMEAIKEDLIEGLIEFKYNPDRNDLEKIV